MGDSFIHSMCMCMSLDGIWLLPWPYQCSFHLVNTLAQCMSRYAQNQMNVNEVATQSDREMFEVVLSVARQRERRGLRVPSDAAPTASRRLSLPTPKT